MSSPGSIAGPPVEKRTKAEEEIRHLDHVTHKFEVALEKMHLNEQFSSLDKELAAALKLKDNSKRFHPLFRDRLIDLLKPVLMTKLKQQVGEKAAAKQKDAMAKLAAERVDEYMQKAVHYTRSVLGGQALIDECEATQVECERFAEYMPERQKIIDQVVKQIKTIKEYEFIKGIVGEGRLTFKGNTDALTALRTKLGTGAKEVHEIAEAAKAALVDADADDGRDGERRAVVTSYLSWATKNFANIGALSVQLENAVNALDIEVNDSAVKAWVFATSPSVQDIKAAKKLADTGIGLAGALAKKTNTSGIFIRLSSLLSSISATALTQAALEKEKSKFRLTHTSGDLFEDYDKNPMLLSDLLQANQLAALEIAVNSIGLTLSASLVMTPGAAEIVMGVWDIIVAAVQGAVKSVLDERTRLALEKMKAEGMTRVPLEPEGRTSFWTKAQDLYESAYSSIEDSIRKAITDNIADPVKELGTTVRKKIFDEAVDTQTAVEVLGAAYSPASTVGGKVEAAKWEFNPYSFTSTLVRLIMPPVMKKVFQYISVPPAEIITGAMLTKMLDDITVSQIPVGMVFGDAVPTPEPTALTGRDDLPAKIDGRDVKRTNANRSVLTGPRPTYYVSMDFDGVEIWGRYDPRLQLWQPTEVDPDSFYSHGDWEKTRIASTYIKKDGGEKIEGVWLRVTCPEKGSDIVAFAPKDGGAFVWGHLMDTPKGPRGRRYQLGAETEGFAERFKIADLYN